MVTSRVARSATFLLLIVRFCPSVFVKAAGGALATASSHSSPECILMEARTINQNRNNTFELILAGDYEQLDGTVLPDSILALKQRGAHRCWHKHSTFLEHLAGVHNILRLWGQGVLYKIPLDS